MSRLEELKTDIARLRDEAQLKLHLAKADARQEWEELETKWHRFESDAKMHHTGERIEDAFQALGDELKAGYHRLVAAFRD